MISLQEYKAAYSWLKRNPGKKQKAGPIRALMHSTNAGVHTSLLADAKNPVFHTACWSFETSPKPRHVIQIGMNLDCQMRPAEAVIPARRKCFIQSIGQHECAHGEFTDRDLEAVARLASAERVPFRLVNLFEDARIEHLYRARYGGNGGGGGAGLFKWDLFGSKFDTVTGKPTSYFFSGICREASSFKSGIATGFQPIQWTGQPTVQVPGTNVPAKTSKVIQEFYSRAILAPDTQAVVDVVKDWVAVFGYDIDGCPPHISSFIGAEQDPLETGGTMKEDTEIAGPDALRPKLAVMPPMDPWKGFMVNSSFALAFMNQHRIKSIMGRLLRILDESDVEHTEFATDGNLRVPGLLCRDYDALFTRTHVASSGRKRMVMIIDMSGSMESYWFAKGGREFAWAFIRMAQLRQIELRVFLTGRGGQRAEMPVMDITESQFRRLKPDDGDGMRDTLLHPRVAAAIVDANVVLVWTDGDLNDPDVGGRQWTSHGIKLIGCSTNVHKLPALRKHFHVAYANDCPVSLAGRVAEAIVDNSRTDNVE